MQWQRNTKKAFATCLHSCNKPRSYPFVNESKTLYMVKIKPRFKYDKSPIEKLFRQWRKEKTALFPSSGVNGNLGKSLLVIV